MIQPKYSPKEALKRAKLMMGYNPSNTLTENEEKIKKLINEQTSSQTLTKILNNCSSRPASEGTLDAASIAAAFNRAFNYQTLYVFGGTDDSLWRAQAEKMKKGNYDDLCNIKKEYEDTFGQQFADGLISELDDEEIAELMETFMAMKYRTDKEAKLSLDKTEQKNINWFKTQFPCIFQSLGNVDQQVRLDANNYVYILIKGTSGAQYQVYSDGRVKKTDGTSTGKKISCQGSKVSFISESIRKKKLSEQIDDSELIGKKENTPKPEDDCKTNPNQEKCKKKEPFVWNENCKIYKIGCKSDVIAKVQGCVGGLTPDGKFGKKTSAKLKELGYDTFTDADVDKICKTKPIEDPNVEDVEPVDPNQQ
jgi:hypothetical protein